MFSDVATPEERLVLVRRLRERADEVRGQIETTVLPAFDRTRERHGQEMPAVVARFGHELWVWMADWCDRLERELAEGG